mgnify:CR=1 FL=1
MTTVSTPQKDERVKNAGLLVKVLRRPEFGAFLGAIAIFILFASTDTTGNFAITVAPRARPGNWLPSGGVEQFALVIGVAGGDVAGGHDPDADGFAAACVDVARGLPQAGDVAVGMLVERLDQR